ncbi:hypothetical protein [Methanobrevibacter curvatus]|uniref:DUF4325 domain-containing protein n=1 Tax=Methanobrevibacter curvatus TaxID=49547 RepID=A0A166DHF7_9EURY|nr:hypothetical protein [Methanobrevibacter curvatus]KZX15606.1 hypothetical protein MBCUR_02400 [Methanobrevibacter curvatus]
MNSATSIFFEKPNKLSEDKIKIDFKDIVFMSRSFLKSILNKKIKLKKTIHEVNLSEEVAPIFHTVEKSFQSAIVSIYKFYNILKI